MGSKRPTAVVIKGNPKYIEHPKTKDRADMFYGSVKDHLESRGYRVSFDPGHPYTQPGKADLWVGHSRGVDRLRFAPKGTRTVALEDGYQGHDPRHYKLTPSLRKSIDKSAEKRKTLDHSFFSGIIDSSKPNRPAPQKKRHIPRIPTPGEDI